MIPCKPQNERAAEQDDRGSLSSLSVAQAVASADALGCSTTVATASCSHSAA